MAEDRSLVSALVSAIADIAADAYKLANTILPIAGDLDTFGSQVETIAKDTKVVGYTLRQIKIRLNRAGDVPSNVTTTLAELVALCAEDIKNMSVALAPLLALDDRAEVRKKRLWGILGKSKIMTRQASLDSLKLMLGLLAHTLDLVEDDTEEYVRDEVMNLAANSRNVRIAFLEAECVDRFMEREFERFNIDPSEAHVSEILSQFGRPASNDSLKMSAVDIMTSISDSGRIDEHIKDIARSHALSADEGFVATEVLASISEDHFLSISSHVRVRKSVLDLAQGVARQEHSAKATAQEAGDSPEETRPKTASIPQVSTRVSQPRASLSTTRSSISKARSRMGEETPGQSSSAQLSEPLRSNASHTSHVGTDDESDTDSDADTMEHRSDTTDDHSVQAASRSSHDPVNDFGIAYIYPGQTFRPRKSSSERVGAPEKTRPDSHPLPDAHRTPPQAHGFSDTDVARFREFQAWERDRQAKDQEETKVRERISLQQEAKEQHEVHNEVVEETGRRRDESRLRQGEGKRREEKKKIKRTERREEAGIEEEEPEEAEDESTAVDARKRDDKAPRKGLRKFFPSRRSRPPVSKPMVLPYGSLTI